MWKSSTIKGLTDAEARRSLSIGGNNLLPAPEQASFWDKYKENFDDPLIHILCVALGVIFVLAIAGYAELMEGGGIGLSIIISTLVATYSEYKNENSFRVLQEKASKIRTLCLRGVDGKKPTQIPIDFLVMEDVVILQGGDKVPADGELVAGSIMVDQSSLNGESVPVEKTARKGLNGDHKHGKEEKEDLESSHRVFRGSVVEEGEAMMKIDGLGKETVFGKLAIDLSSTDKRKQPLKMKLETLAQQIAQLSYAGAVLIAVSFLFKQFVMDNHFSLAETTAYLSKWGVVVHDIVTAVILAIIIVVCAVPEGLPTMIAVVLSLNMSRLLSNQVLVRHLLGIETSGCLEILFTDKTGTVTEGQFSPHAFIGTQLHSYANLDEIPGGLSSVLRFCIEASSSTVVRRDPVTDKLDFFGSNATDASLLKYLYKHGNTRSENVDDGSADCELRKLIIEMDRTHLDVHKEVRFTSKSKFSARSVRFAKGAYSFVNGHREAFRHFLDRKEGSSYQISIVRGAPEILLENCAHGMDSKGELILLDKFERDRIQATVNQLSSKGQRLVAIGATAEPLTDDAEIPRDCILLGVMCLIDKVRPNSIRCIEMAAQAGVQVVMVTGDKSETAVAVAKEIGLLGPHSITDVVINSHELRHMSDQKLAQILPRLAVVARALPSDKARLVTVAQHCGGRAGKVVGMTGDGINDSAALKKADVSFAMGHGAEVAKEASDIVILDNRLSSIISAILYGRTIFKTIRKFVMFQSTINLASTFIVFVGPFMGFDFPLTLIQLLWVNLVMDTLAALAFGGEPADPVFLMEPPLARDQPIISQRMWRSIVSNGLYIAFCSVTFLTWDPILSMFDRRISAELSPVDVADLDYKDTAKVEDVKDLRIQGGPVFLTAFFSFFIFVCTFNAFNVRTPKLNLWQNITKNKGFLVVIAAIFILQILFCQVGGALLRTVPLTLREWACLFIMSVMVVPFDLLRKILFEAEGVQQTRRYHEAALRTPNTPVKKLQIQLDNPVTETNDIKMD